MEISSTSTLPAIIWLRPHLLKGYELNTNQTPFAVAPATFNAADETVPAEVTS